MTTTLRNPLSIALAIAFAFTLALVSPGSVGAAAGEPPIAPDPIVVPDGPDTPAVPGPLGRRLLRLPFLPVDANIVFVLDGSMILSERQNFEMRNAARRTLRMLDIRRNPDLNVGVVMFDSRSRVLCDLMRDERQLFGCVGQVRQRYGHNIVDGLQAAYLQLLGEREHAGVPLGKTELIILFTAGHHTDGCFDVIEKAREIKANGMRLIAVGVGTHADMECLSDLVASPGDLYTIAVP